MEQYTVPAIEIRLERLERRLRLLQIVSALGAVALAGAAYLALRPHRVRADDSAKVLRVSELVIVDEAGVERVRIGGRLPDAVVKGKRAPRGEPAAGILLYDTTGQERSGYVTFPSGNVVLTLDTRERQVATFVAGPNAGAALQLRHGEDWVELRADVDGARLNAVRSRLLVSQEPPMSTVKTAATCSDLRDELKQLKPQPPLKEILDACKQRMPESECRKCLAVR